MDEGCDHSKNKIKIIGIKSELDIGYPPPKYWTAIGKCECGELVEIDYILTEIKNGIR